MNEIFARRLRKLRKAQGLKQRELASAIGVSMYTVSVWERGLQIPEQRTLMKLADFFHVPERCFFDDTISETEPVEGKMPSAASEYIQMLLKQLLNLEDVTGDYIVTISVRKTESEGETL